MNSEIRNELLNLLHYVTMKENNEIYLDFLLERFEIDIKRQLEDLEYQKKQLLDNLETLKYVKEKISFYKEEDQV